MADTSVVNLNTDFVGLRRCNLDLLNAQVFAGLPGDGGLALDGLFVTKVSLVLELSLTFQSCRELPLPAHPRGKSSERGTDRTLPTVSAIVIGFDGGRCSSG